MVKRILNKIREKIAGKKQPTATQNVPTAPIDSTPQQPTPQNKRSHSSRKPRPRVRPPQHSAGLAQSDTQELYMPSAGKNHPAPKANTDTKQTKEQPKKKTKRPPRKKSAKPAADRAPKKDVPPWDPTSFQVPEKEGEKRFHDFDLPGALMHAIYDLGFKYCTPIQAKVLAHFRKGDSIAGQAQTGTGKTAAFLICIFSRFIETKADQQKRPNGTPWALILAPTRELCIQIAKDAKNLDKHSTIRSMGIYGGMDFEKQKRELLNNRVDLIAATPGRLIDFIRRKVIDLSQVQILVIDEADRMLNMGFIPDVRRIVRATPKKTDRQTMLFSATLNDQVLQLAAQWMTEPVICEVSPEKLTVDTVKQVIYIVTVEEKFNLLMNLLQSKEMSRVLIFGNRRDRTMKLAARIRKAGFPCEYLSGAVRQNKRIRVLEDFREGKVNVVVATDVAGRGLHVDNISHVINYEFPYEPEDYVHRIGRTGRAGVNGVAISFACEEESFVIPDIEKYIGNELRCQMPEEHLLLPYKRAQAES